MKATEALKVAMAKVTEWTSIDGVERSIPGRIDPMFWRLVRDHGEEILRALALAERTECTSMGYQVGERCVDVDDCVENGCARGRTVCAT